MSHLRFLDDFEMTIWGSMRKMQIYNDKKYTGFYAVTFMTQQSLKTV